MPCPFLKDPILASGLSGQIRAAPVTRVDYNEANFTHILSGTQKILGHKRSQDTAASCSLLLHDNVIL